jgi:hypothetical protein
MMNDRLGRVLSTRRLCREAPQKTQDSSMPTSDEDCLAHADECRRIADETVALRDRAVWLELATGWLMIAPQYHQSAASPSMTQGKSAELAVEPSAA